MIAAAYARRGPTEKVRSVRVTLPCRSFTDTVSFPLGRSVIDVSSFRS